MKASKFCLAPAAALLAAACGAPIAPVTSQQALEAESLSPPQTAPARLEAAAATRDGIWRAPLSGPQLDETAWHKRAPSCSKVRNACIDAGDDLLQLGGDGWLVLRATAGAPASAEASRSAARYPSLDLVAPEGAIVVDRCIELRVALPDQRELHAGLVLAPAEAAPFTGQFYLASATAGLLRMGIACPADNGSIRFARPVHADFAQAEHVLRFCANVERASWHLDGELWAEVGAEELPEGCGAWPFGEQPSPLHLHASLSPTGSHAQATPAGTMAIADVRIFSAP